jgi:nickel-type superoxide dismutase maturation protease
VKKSGGAGRTQTGRAGLRSLATLLAVEVMGDSMAPTLLAGDRLVVRRVGRRHPLRPGDLVTLSSPPAPDRPPVLVKRVAGCDPSGVEVRGDNPAASTDSRDFGRVPRRAVRAKVVYRYGPAGRTGAVR